MSTTWATPNSGLSLFASSFVGLDKSRIKIVEYQGNIVYLNSLFNQDHKTKQFSSYIGKLAALPPNYMK